MKIVIDIAQNEYDALDKLDAGYLLHIIKDGTPLPEGHGALKDEKDLIAKVELNYRNSTKPIYVGDVKDMIRTTVSVITADKEGNGNDRHLYR